MNETTIDFFPQSTSSGTNGDDVKNGTIEHYYRAIKKKMIWV